MGLYGVRSACHRVWPGTRIQRCPAARAVRHSDRLASRPRLQAGREPSRPSGGARCPTPGILGGRTSSTRIPAGTAHGYPGRGGGGRMAAAPLLPPVGETVPGRRSVRVPRLVLLAGGPAPSATKQLEGGLTAWSNARCSCAAGCPRERVWDAPADGCVVRNRCSETLNAHPGRRTRAGRGHRTDDTATEDEPVYGTGIDWNEHRADTKHPT